MSADEVENLAKLPPAEVLRAQLVGAIVSPLTTVVATRCRRRCATWSG